MPVITLKYHLIVDGMLIVFIVFGVMLAIQLFYYFFFYIRIARQEDSPSHFPRGPVSVVICARDESPSLRRNLPLVLEQDYPEYEVVVVNDCSDDDSETVLAELKLKYPHLSYSTIKKDPKFRHGKKLALTLGIKAAKNDIVILTDADCQPMSRQWIAQMQKQFDTSTEYVLGYGGYYQHKGFVNKMIRLDTLFIAMQYLGFALAGIPYMGIGRNLAYRKSTFLNQKGFANHSHIESGDDDLYINQNAKKGNTRVCLHPNGFTRSEPKLTFHSWMKQKRRHLTTAIHYTTPSKLLLMLEPISRYSFYGLFIFLLIKHSFLLPVLILFTVRWIVVLTVFKIGMSRLKEKDLFLSSLIYDISMPAVNFMLTLLNLVATKQHTWK